MPHLQTLVRRALAVLATVATLSIPTSAVASTEADFSIVFPQDALATTFVDSYGFARSGGRRHQGNDLMAAKMTPVYAAADGIVDSISEGGTAGRRIIIDHGDAWETWYLHLNNDTPGTDDGRADWADTIAPGIEEGSAVYAGQLIGWVGDSGNAEGTGAHTHFELHHGGSPVDPYPYLIQPYRAELAELMVDIVPRVGTFLTDVGSVAAHMVGDLAVESDFEFS